MSDRVLVTIEDGIADVRLNRPEKLNALDGQMFKAIADAGESLKERSDVRAVVLSGAGRSFCAGLDFASFQAMGDSGDSESGGVDEGASTTGNTLEGRITHMGQQAAWVWQELEVPVIGAITGHALGGGFQIAMGPDIRIVHPDTKMSVLEIRWGLVPDMGASVLLPPLVGLDVAKEMYFTGKMISGTEAVELGVATRVDDDPHTAALELAQEIASKNPDAIRRMKDILNGLSTRNTAERFAAERQHIGALIGSPNQTEAVAAFFEKRPPEFD
ncbi:MAG: crotonase/enoyl-CoA hydratase family protein [Actinomycetota bacterium]|nr:enoyl-CoA hydratase [Acidimicrobiaceae bacterium]MEC7916773.1 crotonase/enoyl-CoA hydratase family protein [Actinomycetota bacterium]MED5361242.1 crotonase/enoyl-CoA hydratase family protein [Actinomycetota bacterium]MEE3257178.1 crotonase/enoyl-CoA hydratase family protein [Actinomycetota bacterium]